jgi:hypothetical protein
MSGECPFCYEKLERGTTEDTDMGTKVHFSCPNKNGTHEPSEATKFYVYVNFRDLEY